MHDNVDIKSMANALSDLGERNYNACYLTYDDLRIIVAAKKLNCDIVGWKSDCDKFCGDERVDWCKLYQYERLSEEFMDEFPPENSHRWEIALQYQNLSCVFLVKHLPEIGKMSQSAFKAVIRTGKLSEDFWRRQEMRGVVNRFFGDIIAYQDVSEDFFYEYAPEDEDYAPDDSGGKGINPYFIRIALGHRDYSDGFVREYGHYAHKDFHLLWSAKRSKKLNN